MPHKINIILAKASWCPHCVHFTPIYEMAQQKINSKQHLDNNEITFDSFELDKNEQMLAFKDKHPGLIDYINGYPTVYFKMTEKSNGKEKIESIEHVIANGKHKKAIEEAAYEFINNIINKYKTLKSDNSELHISVPNHPNHPNHPNRPNRPNTPNRMIQRGGMQKFTTSIENAKYRDKYLKYKSKYLKLKNE